jgi:Flp pilus assembly protein TadD
MNDYDIAVNLHRQGHFPEAERHYRTALVALPKRPAVLHGLALLCIQTGRAGEALGLLRQAAAAAPDDAMIRHHHGLLLMRLGSPREAAVESEAAVALRPDFADALSNLGLAYGALGAPDKALAALRQAAALAPDDAEICNNLGEMYLRLDEPETALTFFDKSLALRPRAIAAHLGRSEALAAAGRQNEALASVDRALAADPQYAAAHFARGTLLRQLGRFDEADVCFTQAVALAGDVARYHRALAESHRFSDGDPRLAALEKLDPDQLVPSQQVEREFALFKAYDDLGHPGEAFAHLARGNGLYRQQIPYDEVGVFAIFRALQGSFTPALMQHWNGAGSATNAPVFIVGMPRSGTTLIEQILASHPDVFAAGELTAFQKLTAEILPGYPESTSDITAERLHRLGEGYLAHITRIAGRGARRVTDKLPANFRHLGLIHLALPDARIIHVRRDPRDTCFSCYSKLFRSGLNFAYDLGELGRYYRAYQGVMAHWHQVLPPATLLEVQYEKLVADFEPEARRIVEFCGLEWDTHCLKFHETKRAVRTLSEAQVRVPLFASSIGRWRVYEPWLAPLLDLLGGA